MVKVGHAAEGQLAARGVASSLEDGFASLPVDGPVPLAHIEDEHTRRTQHTCKVAKDFLATVVLKQVIENATAQDAIIGPAIGQGENIADHKGNRQGRMACMPHGLFNHVRGGIKPDNGETFASKLQAIPTSATSGVENSCPGGNP